MVIMDVDLVDKGCSTSMVKHPCFYKRYFPVKMFVVFANVIQTP